MCDFDQFNFDIRMHLLSLVRPGEGGIQNSTVHQRDTGVGHNLL